MMQMYDCQCSGEENILDVSFRLGLSSQDVVLCRVLPMGMGVLGKKVWVRVGALG